MTELNYSDLELIIKFLDTHRMRNSTLSSKGTQIQWHRLVLPWCLHRLHDMYILSVKSCSLRVKNWPLPQIQDHTFLGHLSFHVSSQIFWPFNYVLLSSFAGPWVWTEDLNCVSTTKNTQSSSVSFTGHYPLWRYNANKTCLCFFARKNASFSIIC